MLAGDAETWEARAPRRAVMEMREGIVKELSGLWEVSNLMV
jgi:hypothetical protein